MSEAQSNTTWEVSRGESYWTVAEALLARWAPELPASNHYIGRIHKRLIQLNQHDNNSLDPNSLDLPRLRLPAPSTILKLPHGQADGRTISAQQFITELHAISDGVSYASFCDCIVVGDVDLRGLRLPVHACLRGTTFRNDVTITQSELGGFLCLQGCDFHGQVVLRSVEVEEDVHMENSTFRGDLVIDSTKIKGALSLNDASFRSAAWVSVEAFGPIYLGGITGAPSGFYLQKTSSLAGVFGVGAKLDASLYLLAVETAGDLSLTRNSSGENLTMRECDFGGRFLARGLDIPGRLEIVGLTAAGVNVEESRCGGLVAMELTVTEGIDLGGFVMEGAADLTLSAQSVRASNLSMLKGGAINLRRGDLFIPSASFPENTILRGVADPKQARLVDLTDSRVTALALSRVDLSLCHFAGVHDLDKLRIEDDVAWGQVPKAGPGRWATRRRVIREEVVYRARRGSAGWPAGDPLNLAREKDPLPAHRIANIYRGLRKAFEDRKNEPGAADFYYGEMEMRRLGSESSAERMLLTGYWLVSGYSLRAWRALMALAVLIACATLIMAAWGFAPVPSPNPQIAAVSPAGIPVALYVDPATGNVTRQRPGEAADNFDERLVPALTYSAESATVVFRGPDARSTTDIGRWCQIILRLFGPALLALALLSLRGRVKR